MGIHHEQATCRGIQRVNIPRERRSTLLRKKIQFEIHPFPPTLSDWQNLQNNGIIVGGNVDRHTPILPCRVNMAVSTKKDL